MNTNWLLFTIAIVFGLALTGCQMDDADKKDASWTPARRSFDSPWDIYLVGERTINTSGSVYGGGSSTDTFDGTNVFKADSYQHWQGGGKYSESTCYITRIELYKGSWESYPAWRIFFKIGTALWHSESDFNESIELSTRVPTVLNGKSLEDFVTIPGQ